jgi:hypothetical protein
MSIVHCAIRVSDGTELTPAAFRTGFGCAMAAVEIGDDEDLAVLGDPQAMRRLADYLVIAALDAERLDESPAEVPWPDCESLG